MTHLQRHEVQLFFENRWADAFKINAFDTLCALLRVDGMAGAFWDPFEETERSFKDYNWYINASSKELSEYAPLRIFLLVYCQIVESSGIHDSIMNLCRLLAGESYHCSPFEHLYRKDKKHIMRHIPPSATWKWKEIEDKAKDIRLSILHDMIQCFYSRKIRNAFSHSDYIIGEGAFRWVDGGLPESQSIEDVSALLKNAMEFTLGFMNARNAILKLLGQTDKYHKFNEYEVLEYIVGDGGKLTGFKVHFSNGVVAKFDRNCSGVECVNMKFNSDGSVAFLVGILDELEPRRKINGKVVDFCGRNSLDKI